MGLELKDIKEIIELINKTDITKFEYEYDDMRIGIEKKELIANNSGKIEKLIQHEILESDPNKFEKNIHNSVKVEAKEQIVSDDENIYLVKSPIVGTFYDSPSPDSSPFVKIGDRVKKGDVLCIIEAMKIMNEIKAEYDGTIEELMLENEDIVEYNQPIMVIRR
ncbi:MAG: acetyl-CoA carboxylase biotin carboxyl carrier protein [Andreesenia angusta]|nr:acetyl-CoA carboxylase biotin carboxyl carrier protein [Andreesenia angusta]